MALAELEQPQTTTAENTVAGDATSETPAAVRNQLRYAKPLLVISDVLALCGAMYAAYGLRRLANWDDLRVEASGIGYARFALAGIPGFVFFYFQQRCYTARFVTRRVDEFRRVFNAVVGGVLILMVLGYVTKTYLSRAWLVSSVPIGVTFSMTSREVARRYFRSKREGGNFLRKVVIVGANAEGIELFRMLDADPTLGYQVVGLIDDRNGSQARKSTQQTIDETIRSVRENDATSVIIAATALDIQVTNRLIRTLLDSGVHVEMSSALSDIAAERLTVRALGRMPVVYLEPVHRTGWRPMAKRAFDVVSSAGLLALLAIPSAIVAVIIKLDSKGPVLFGQERLGKDGRIFRVLKFRSMVTDAEAQLAKLAVHNEASGPLFKMKHDPRITRIGGLIRKTSIDEIPQLVNVLRGDMSLVGPRPALAKEAELWPDELHNRLRVKPGMTGMWQVNGRSNSSFEEYTRLDLYYVDNWSLLTDLIIMAKTIPAVMASRGAS